MMKNSEVKKTLREWSTDPDFLDEVAFMELMSRFVLDVMVFWRITVLPRKTWLNRDDLSTLRNAAKTFD